MKVSNKLPSAMQNAENAQAAKSSKLGNAAAALEGQKSRGAANAGDSVRVELSPQAQEIKKAKELATPNMDSVDDAKVARLQKLIDEGKYKVNAEAIADRLLDEHLKMS